MAFCRYCGRQLGENELCGCPQSMAAAEMNGTQPTPQPAPQYIPPQTVTPKANTFDFVKSMQGAWQSFLSIMKKPAEGCAEFVKKADVAAAVILIVVQSLIYWLVSLIILSDMQGIAYYEEKAFKFSLIVLIVSLGYAAAYAGIMTGAFAIVKSKVDFVKALCITAVKRIPCMLAVLVTLILRLIEADWFMGPIIIAFGLGLILVSSGLEAVTDVNKNVKTYLFVSVTAVAGIVLYIIYCSVITNDMARIADNFLNALTMLGYK